MCDTKWGFNTNYGHRTLPFKWQSSNGFHFYEDKAVGSFSVCVCGLTFPSTAIGKRAIEKESLACTKFCVKREARKDPNSRCRVSRLINLEESPLTKKNFRPAHLPALREDS